MTPADLKATWLTAPDDLGLTATKQLIQDAQEALAKKFDEAIGAFISGIEGHDIELPMHAEFVAKRAHVVEPTRYSPDVHDEGNFSYFIWRSDEHGVRVMAYRFSSGFHARDDSRGVVCEMDFQHGELPRAQWPEALVAFIERGLK